MWLIGVAGGSCSGKTTFSNFLASKLENVQILYLDDYFIPQGDPKKFNFDRPESIDIKRLIEDIKKIENGERLKVPYNPFGTKKEYEIYNPKILILEGLFSFYWNNLRSMQKYKIFLESPTDDIVIERRKRKLKEMYNMTEEEIIWQYWNYVKPGYINYVVYQRDWADFVLNPIQEVEALEYFSKKVASMISFLL